MKGLKITLLIFVCMALANCKVTFNDVEDVIKVEDEEEGSYYVGDVESIQYYRGGWMGPADIANYSNDLKLRVVDGGKIQAQLDNPDCRLSGKLNPNQYSKLANMIEDAQATRKHGSGMDDGVEVVSLEVAGEEQRYHLSRAAYSNGAELHIEREAAAEIREFILEIISQLKEKYGCNGTIVNSKIKTLHLVQTLLNQNSISPNMGAANYYNPTTSIKRDFKIYNDNGVLKVSGSENINSGGGSFCHRNLNNKEIDADIITEIELIEISRVEFICMMAPLGDRSTSIRLTYLNGASEIGYEGCWNTEQVRNHQKFMNKFLKWLDKQDQACGAYAATNE